MSDMTPHCIGFIMDGNRRWAREQGLSTQEGHTRGEQTLHQVVEWVATHNIPHAVFYAFSTENWRRSEAEVGYLMALMESLLRRLREEIAERNIRVRIVGRRHDFSEDMQAMITAVEAASDQVQDPETTVWIALSYGGRAELIAAANELVRRGAPVTEATFTEHMWTAHMPDPDCIVRTGGEQRLSNFLPWQSVYSELFFLDTYWPAFTKDEFTDILEAYATRQRRRGA